MLANDGVRPDDPERKQIIPREFLLDATDWKRVAEAFRPRRATPYYGYSYKFWLFPGEQPAQWVRIHQPSAGRARAAHEAFRVRIEAGGRPMGSIWAARERGGGNQSQRKQQRGGNETGHAGHFRQRLLIRR